MSTTITLEQRYNQAAGNTYVGMVRTTQADGKAGNGVNFMNGEGFTGRPPAPDAVQTEFKKNDAGDFRYGAGDKNPAGTNNKTYPLSRWLPKGVDKADTYLIDRYKKLNDVRNGNKDIHKYDWRTAGNSFAGMSPTAKNRIDGSAAGPSPGGING